jgi:hypothetical protein
MPIQLPTESWRERKAEERREFEAGEISKEDCYMDRLFPDPFVDRTEQLLKEFVASVEQCSPSVNDFPQVMQSIEALVVALNKVNEDFDHGVIETDEREEICSFIDEVVIAKGIDIEALAASQNCGRHELTDQWRDW